MLKTRFSFVCKYQPWYKTLINDKRMINKFSNDILSTQRETWSNWKRIRDKRWASFSIGTSQLKGTRMTQQWRIKKRELAIFLLTIEVQCLDGRFAFAWKKNSPAQNFWQKIVIQKNRSKTFVWSSKILLKAVAFTSITTFHPSLRTNSSSSRLHPH